MSGLKNAYEVLGVPRTATSEDIRKAYRQMMVEINGNAARNNSEIVGPINCAYLALIGFRELYEGVLRGDRKAESEMYRLDGLKGEIDREYQAERTRILQLYREHRISYEERGAELDRIGDAIAKGEDPRVAESRNFIKCREVFVTAREIAREEENVRREAELRRGREERAEGGRPRPTGTEGQERSSGATRQEGGGHGRNSESSRGRQQTAEPRGEMAEASTQLRLTEADMRIMRGMQILREGGPNVPYVDLGIFRFGKLNGESIATTKLSFWRFRGETPAYMVNGVYRGDLDLNDRPRVSELIEWQNRGMVTGIGMPEGYGAHVANLSRLGVAVSEGRPIPMGVARAINAFNVDGRYDRYNGREGIFLQSEVRLGEVGLKISQVEIKKETQVRGEGHGVPPGFTPGDRR